LKHFLTNALIFKIADPDKQRLVCTYACKEGIGGALMHEGKVVFYESSKLNEHK